MKDPKPSPKTSPEKSSGRKLIVFADSPTLQTGFARVTRNLLPRWHQSGYFDDIWVWGIGYRGFPQDEFPFLATRLCPAASYENLIWWEQENLIRFLKQLVREDIGYTHCWMMHDPVNFMPLADALRDVRNKHGIHLSLYFPADAPMMAEWTRMLSAVDTAVAYCPYGQAQAAEAYRQHKVMEGMAGDLAALRAERFRKTLKHLPHGVDTVTYFPLPEERRMACREKHFAGQLAPDEFLITVVNMHQKRKGIYQALDTFRWLRQTPEGRRAKLYLHMPERNVEEGTDLPILARELGLPLDAVYYGEKFFHGNYAKLEESALNEIYNMADLVLTTTHGEGWGLTVTEALAAGRPVAAPFITSLGDILSHETAVELPVFDGCHVQIADHNRPRPLVDARGAADVIAAAMADPEALAALGARGRSEMLKSDYDWDNIARQWLQIFSS